MIKFKNVIKNYQNDLVALDKLSMTINQGEFVYLVGPSGAGKSTLIKLIYREEKATSGIIEVLNNDLNTIKQRQIPYLRRKIGVVFQDFKLLPKLTVFENIAYAMQVIEKTPNEIKTRVGYVLDLVNLKDKANNFPNELSGGEQQRISIARAIANQPKLLIADEPTGNLDPKTADGIMQILNKINLSGTTILMATHNSAIVDQYKHRVIEIKGGKISRDERKGSYLNEIDNF